MPNFKRNLMRRWMIELGGSMPRLARYLLSILGFLCAVFAVAMNRSFAMLIPALFIMIMCHWMAMDSHWSRGNRCLFGQMLLSILGLSLYVFLGS